MWWLNSERQRHGSGRSQGDAGGQWHGAGWSVQATFRTCWADHNVRFHRTGTKQLHHPVVGHLDLTFEAMELPADPGLTLLVYTAEAGSPTQDALNLLASRAATPDQPEIICSGRALEQDSLGCQSLTLLLAERFQTVAASK